MNAEVSGGPSLSKSPYRLDIQGLRGLAVVLVVLYHADLPVPGGYVGVDVFFVISGFVIANLLLTELRATGTIAMRRFYARRIRRLLPALALLLVGVTLMSVFLLSPFGPQQVTARTAVAASAFAANVYIYRGTGDYFADASESNPLLHTWSLAVEEQFYLVFPLLLLITWIAGARWGRGRTRPEVLVVLSLLVVGAVSLSMSAAAGFDLLPIPVDSLQSFAFYAMPFRAWEFAAGALLVPCVPYFSRLGTRSAAVLSLGGIGLVVAAALLFDDSTTFPGVAAIAPVLGTAALIAAGAVPGATSSLRRILESSPAVFVGDISYGWYLWHWPAIVFAQVLWPNAGPFLLVAAVLSLLPTLASYHLVENPVRRSPAWPWPRLVALASAGVFVPIAFAAILTLGSNDAWGLEAGDQFAERRLARAACTDTQPIFPAEACTWTVDAPAGLVVLLGDSHATSLSDGLVAAGNELGYDVAVWARSGCPFSTSPTFGATGCGEYQRAALDFAIAEADLVVVANRSPGYTLPPVGEGSSGDPWRTVSNADGTIATSPEDALEAWRRGVAGIVDPLSTMGVPVLLMSTVPEFDDDFAAQVSIIRPLPSSVTVSLSEVEARRSPSLAVEAAVLGGYENVLRVDPAEVLCSSTYCSPIRDGIFIYMDEQHLNPEGSLLLAPMLVTAIEALVR